MTQPSLPHTSLIQIVLVISAHLQSAVPSIGERLMTATRSIPTICSLLLRLVCAITGLSISRNKSMFHHMTPYNIHTHHAMPTAQNILANDATHATTQMNSDLNWKPSMRRPKISSVLPRIPTIHHDHWTPSIHGATSANACLNVQTYGL